MTDRQIHLFNQYVYRFLEDNTNIIKGKETLTKT